MLNIQMYKGLCWKCSLLSAHHQNVRVLLKPVLEKADPLGIEPLLEHPLVDAQAPGDL